MYAVRAKITRCVDDTAYPSWVECEFVDARGQNHVFSDKDAIFTVESIDRNTPLPVDCQVVCKLLERRQMDGRKTVVIDTSKPWAIESTEGKTVFEVFADELFEFDADKR